MEVPKKILCVCLGNSDRSPFMAKILGQLLENQDRNDIVVESAGVSDSAKSGTGAPPLSIAAAPTYGIDLSYHRKRHVSQVDLHSFDLIIAAEKEVQGMLVGDYGVKAEIICLELAGASNPWMSQNPRKIDGMIAAIYSALVTEVIQYKFRV
jgi:protein-tyrosine-phosphatase